MDKIIDIIFILIVAILIFGGITWSAIENDKYIYECTDYKGDTVYCTHAYMSKGGMFGYLEDGTLTTITSYKRILKEE